MKFQTAALLLMAIVALSAMDITRPQSPDGDASSPLSCRSSAFSHLSESEYLLLIAELNELEQMRDEGSDANTTQRSTASLCSNSTGASSSQGELSERSDLEAPSDASTASSSSRFLELIQACRGSLPEDLEEKLQLEDAKGEAGTHERTVLKYAAKKGGKFTCDYIRDTSCDVAAAFKENPIAGCTGTGGYMLGSLAYHQMLAAALATHGIAIVPMLGAAGVVYWYGPTEAAKFHYNMGARSIGNCEESLKGLRKIWADGGMPGRKTQSARARLQTPHSS